MAPRSNISQESIDSSIKFQKACSERAIENMGTLTNESESQRFKRLLLGTLIVGSSGCLVVGGLIILAQNFK